VVLLVQFGYLIAVIMNVKSGGQPKTTNKKQ